MTQDGTYEMPIFSAFRSGTPVAPTSATMSTKSKRRMSRRHQEPKVEARVESVDKRQVAGEIVGQLLQAVTFGATEPPNSVRKS